MHTTRGNICMLFLHCRFVPLDSCWHISHYRELYVIDPYHSNIPSQAQMELGKKILRGFQNTLEYLRDFTISECIPYTLPLQHSADSELWAVCVHDDAHVSYLKKKSRTTSTSTSAEQCWLFGYLLLRELYEYQSVL